MGKLLLLLAIAYAGFFLNLFNLIPMSPFDGGRITAVLSPRIWLLGVPVMLALLLFLSLMTQDEHDMLTAAHAVRGA